MDVGSIPRKEKAAFRENWKVDVGQSVKSMAVYVFSSSRRMFGGHMTARKWENGVLEVARKIVIYNAILEIARRA